MTDSRYFTKHKFHKVGQYPQRIKRANPTMPTQRSAVPSIASSLGLPLVILIPSPAPYFSTILPTPSITSQAM
jgi:hypothetical protein